MTFIKTPMKGMPEQLPSDMIIKEYLLDKIKKTYDQFGFSLIETPCIEHIENLTSNQGGDNEKLIFKILKRGEKLNQDLGLNDLCDSGLRYDLTVPLARFYANNINNLTVPFKALQIGNVWRADRPQKGRFRQFMQCDIDIIGDNTNLAEIELISATVNMLHTLGFNDATVRINDRKLLKKMALSCNIEEELLDKVFIILDKYDKIGLNGIKTELKELGLDDKQIDLYSNFFKDNENIQNCKDYFSKFNYVNASEITTNLDSIISCVREIISGKGKIVFDPTLVRGMSYYTGTIFEIELASYHLSVGGGGRYDKMIGKFCGLDVPACGFSIGFERILSILKENNFVVPSQLPMSAYLIDKEVSYNKIKDVMAKVASLRANGEKVLVSPRNKNVRLQKEKLSELGYTKFVDVFENTEI